METTAKRQNVVHGSDNDALDDKMRSLLRKVFPENPRFSSLPTVREFFATLIGRYERQLSWSRKKLGMPELDSRDVARELLFLQNLEGSYETIQERTATLWQLFTEASSVVARTGRTDEGTPAANLAVFRLRVGQYVHLIRNARRVSW